CEFVLGLEARENAKRKDEAVQAVIVQSAFKSISEQCSQGLALPDALQHPLRAVNPFGGKVNRQRVAFRVFFVRQVTAPQNRCGGGLSKRGSLNKTFVTVGG